MKIYNYKNTLSHLRYILLGSFLTAIPAQAAMINIVVGDDGDVANYGTTVNTTGASADFIRSGGTIVRYVILEFNLSALDDTTTIDSVTLNLTKNGTFSNTGSNPVEIDIFASNGDGVVNISDYSAGGTQVVDTSVSISPTNPIDGTVFNFAFTDVNPVQAALAGDNLTVRLATVNFGGGGFATLETPNPDFSAANLTINHTPIPEPTSSLLLGLGACLGVMRRRR